MDMICFVISKIMLICIRIRLVHPCLNNNPMPQVLESHVYVLQILVRISLQYAPNGNERKTQTKRTKNERTHHTNDTKNARYTKRTHDTRTNESLERNHILSNDKRSWFYRSTI